VCLKILKPTLAKVGKKVKSWIIHAKHVPKKLSVAKTKHMPNKLWLPNLDLAICGYEANMP
jgi:cbb3-type cytochrome oxidase cytochrome c subunit